MRSCASRFSRSISVPMSSNTPTGTSTAAIRIGSSTSRSFGTAAINDTVSATPMISTPPNVGVPAFVMCVSGPSLLIDLPSFLSRNHAMSGYPSSSAITAAAAPHDSA